jgi:hypothetical protein
MRSRSIGVVVGVVGLSAAVCLTSWLAPAGSWLAAALSPEAVLAITAPVKLAFLAAAAWWALGVRDRLEDGNPARRSWGLLSLGFLGLLAGHLTLAPEQVLHGTTPFPSAADLFFIPAQASLVVAFAGFLRAYRASGLFVDPGRRRATALLVLAVLAVAAVAAWPIVRAPGTALERALGVAYPALDLALLVPLALLVRLTNRMLGSEIWKVWATLLTGFLCFAAGDVLFAWVSALGLGGVGALMGLPYLLAYGLAAAGTRLQLRLVAEEVPVRDAARLGRRGAGVVVP